MDPEILENHQTIQVIDYFWWSTFLVFSLVSVVLGIIFGFLFGYPISRAIARSRWPNTSIFKNTKAIAILLSIVFSAIFLFLLWPIMEEVNRM